MSVCYVFCITNKTAKEVVNVRSKCPVAVMKGKYSMSVLITATVGDVDRCLYQKAV